jgi:ABC-type multidrug transport system fused ATPase/permease subunit
LNKLLSNIKTILTASEKRSLLFLVAADALVSLADIAALAALLLIIGSYTGQISTKFIFIQQHIEACIVIFFGVFVIKNMLAFIIRKKQVVFCYKVAARLSRKKMLQYLQGNHRQYSTTDSSVHIKQISQVPVEFAHCVLSGLQQVATQLILVAIAVVAITWFNARLFLLVLLILLPAALVAAAVLKKKIQQARLHTKPAAKNHCSTCRRRWLRVPKAGYTGLYTHELFGNINITQTNNRLQVHFNTHPNLSATLTCMDKGEWLLEYNNIEYGIFAVKFTKAGKKITAVDIKANDFVEYDAYKFVKK